MKSYKDCVVIGLALFAMFFGAGNLIFPPQLGVLSGSSWIEACIGFFTTDLGLSVLAIVAIAKVGGSFGDFAGKVGKSFSVVLGTFIMLAVGPLMAIPRTGAVSFEMGVEPIFGGVNQYVFTFIYFLVALLFVLNPKGVIDKIGKWLTPVLLLSLAAIIVRNIVSPIGISVESSNSNVFTYAFLQGYQTVDGLAAVMFASIVLHTLKEKGYTCKNVQIRMTIASSLVAFGIIGFVYGGLIYLGSTGSGVVGHDLSRTETFVSLVYNVFGNIGIWIVSITVLFACFTTTAGLTATVSEYFTELSKNKISYKVNAIIITAVSFLLSNFGVDEIVRIAGPLLNITYPIIIVLVLLNLVDKGSLNKSIYIGAVGGTFLFTSLYYISPMFEFLLSLKEILIMFPLDEYGMGWVLPALGGILIYKLAEIVRQFLPGSETVNNLR